jgi:hypothetical protein
VAWDWCSCSSWNRSPSEPVDDVVEWVEQTPVEDAPEESDAGSDDLARLGVVGLALGSGVGAWVEYALLRRRTRERIDEPPSLGAAVRPLVVPALAAIVAVVAVQLVTDGRPLVVQAAAVGLAGGLAFGGVAWATGVDEVTRLRGRLPRARSDDPRPGDDG